MVQSLTEETFAAALAENDALVVDFYADWCAPCRMLGPVVEQVSESFPQVAFARVNVDDCPQLSQQFGVQSIPLLVFFKEGKQVDSLLGFRPYDEVAAAVEGLV